MTATSANGLSFMWEMIYIASSMRLPIVMSLVNRAVSGPLNIHNDHSDAMGVRDARLDYAIFRKQPRSLRQPNNGT